MTVPTLFTQSNLIAKVADLVALMNPYADEISQVESLCKL